jgi:hypothetical protein
VLYIIITAYREPLVYNFQVARELLKQIYVAERLQLPSTSAIQNAYSTLWSRAINPSYWTKDFFRNGDVYKVGLYGLEAYGIFKVSTRTFHLILYVPCCPTREEIAANARHLDWRDYWAQKCYRIQRSIIAPAKTLSAPFVLNSKYT